MTTNTRPVPNLTSPIGASADGKTKMFLIAPWIQFFQQFVQKAAAVIGLNVTASPFSYTPNQLGHVVITGGNVTQLLLMRGDVSINITGQKIIPMSIGDTIEVTYSVLPTIQFLGS